MAATADQSPSAGYQHARTGVQVATALNLADTALQPSAIPASKAMITKSIKPVSTLASN